VIELPVLPTSLVGSYAQPSWLINRERLGELMKRQGFQRLLEATGLEPDPRMVKEPRSNPYIFWKEDEVEGGWLDT